MPFSWDSFHLLFIYKPKIKVSGPKDVHVHYIHEMFEEYYPKSTWFIIEEEYSKSTWFMANSMSVCLVDWWRVHLQRPPPSAFTSWTWSLRNFSSKDIFGELFAHIYHRSWHVILIIKKFRFSSKTLCELLAPTTEVGTQLAAHVSLSDPPTPS